jgi:SAM-dependent methyltransferase
MMAITLTKDTPFTILLLVLTMLVLKAVVSRGAWLQRPCAWLALGLTAALVSLLRQNGLIAGLGTLLALLLTYRQSWRRVGCAIGLTGLLVVAVRGPFYSWLGAQPSDHMPGLNYIALHHIAAHLDAGTPLQPEERALIDRLRPPKAGWPYRPDFSDELSFDGQLNYAEARRASTDMVRLALTLAWRAPGTAARHMIESSAYLWRIRPRPPELIWNIGIMVTPERRVVTIDPRWPAFANLAESKLPGLQVPIASWLQESYLDRRLSWLFWRPALYLHLGLLAVLLAVARARSCAWLLVLVPLLLNTATVALYGVAASHRYGYPQQLIVMVVGGFLALAVPLRRRDEGRGMRDEKRQSSFIPHPSSLTPASEQDSPYPRVAACPVCQGKRVYYAFPVGDHRLDRCKDCGLCLLNPQPSDEQLAPLGTATAFPGDSEHSRQQTAAMKQATARRYLREIARYRGRTGGRLLEIGCGSGDLLLEAQAQGYQVTGVDIAPAAVAAARCRVPGANVICGQPESAALPPGSFDVCVLCEIIEHVRSPLQVLQRVRQLLKPDGVLYLVTPALDSWSARLLGQNWTEYKAEHLTLFSTSTMHNLLWKAGYGQVVIRPNWQTMTLRCIADYFERCRAPFVGPLMRLLCSLIPWPLRNLRVPVITGGMTVHAHVAPVVQRPRLSVIVPAYNEAATFDVLMRRLLAKKVPGLDIEIVVVESNSRDGTRERALAYGGHPRVRLVLEERPRGKGHAVRSGFAHATGDFVLIQDADLEYDLDDYDALLEPLQQGRAAFVLGARHGGKAYKMRMFTNQRLLSGFLNCGHLFFRTLVNLLFRLRLKDPFTMFKVFRRDCLAGLTFQCNRFDFDYELLIKLVRKGVRPIEIPVNYRSRSFREGKKVSVFRDPLTWLWALLRLRFTRMDPVGEIGRQSAVEPTSRDAERRAS